MSGSLLKLLRTHGHLLPAVLIILTLGTLALTLLPVEFLGQSRIWSYDKLGHLALFGGWTFLFGLYLYSANAFKLHLFSIFASGVLFGVLIEVLQYLLPLNRHADLFDIAFDSLGSLLAVLLLKSLLPDEEE